MQWRDWKWVVISDENGNSGSIPEWVANQVLSTGWINFCGILQRVFSRSSRIHCRLPTPHEVCPQPETVMTISLAYPT